MCKVNELPFGLPFEICEKIFLELNATTLMNSILVAKSWKNVIENSKCMEKIALLVGQEAYVEEILISDREYRILRFVRSNPGDVLKCLHKFGQSAKKIEILSCFHLDKTVSALNLASVRELTLSNVPSEILQPIMHFHENLKVLNLSNVSKHGNDLLYFLKLNSNLQELNLYLDDFCNIFNDDISPTAKFHLKSVTISFKSNFELDARTLANVESFLIQQGETLRTIDLINAASLNSIYHAWNHLKVVERLHFFSADPFQNCDPQQHSLNENTTLKAFECHLLGPLALGTELLQPILRVAVNLRHLGVWFLTADLVELSASKLNNLKSLSCATMEVDCEHLYEQLKSKRGSNKSIKLHQYL